jgi:hypothetical protein
MDPSHGHEHDVTSEKITTHEENEDQSNRERSTCQHFNDTRKIRSEDRIHSTSYSCGYDASDANKETNKHARPD